MQIADFLEHAKDEIIREAISYARTIRALSQKDESVLRDHLPKILEAISMDLRLPQSRTESIDKAQGRSYKLVHPALQPSGAETHGVLRAQSGLLIEEVVAEYRALRSCVIRLWTEGSPPDPDALRDVGRFNEAIDQALAESVKTFSAEVELWQNLFLGVLGHDLRGPLNAILMTAEVLFTQGAAPRSPPLALLKRSTRRMSVLMDSLLEFNRANLGSGMLINRLSVDLAAACAEELEMQRSALPGASITFTAQGGTLGHFDESRVREALANLVTNAVKHGLSTEPVLVRLEGLDTEVRLIVENAVARDISPSQLERLFEPLRRGGPDKPSPGRSHLGLGLFIVRQIAEAHGGKAYGHSTANRVAFTMTLPKAIAG